MLIFIVVCVGLALLFTKVGIDNWKGLENYAYVDVFDYIDITLAFGIALIFGLCAVLILYGYFKDNG